jgi:hypothetical protein
LFSSTGLAGTPVILNTVHQPGHSRAFGLAPHILQYLRASTRYLYFDDWDTVMSFMCRQLEMAPD